MKVSRVSEMRAMDRTAIEKHGISAEMLMENAGHAAYFALRNEFGVPNKRFLIFCGLGNNGGDGLVLAQKIHANGGQVHVALLGDSGKYREPAKMNFEIVSHLPIKVWGMDELEIAREAIADCDLIVDAIFGTGLSRDVEGVYRKVIEWINASHKPVLSIDIPSGVHGNSGKVMGVAVEANLTVTFGLPKLGNMLSPGYELGGKLFVSHISFPPSLHQSDSLKIEINQTIELPPRALTGQRGVQGKLLTIGGSVGNLEAPYVSAHAFLRAGGSVSRLATPKSITPYIAGKDSEITLIPQEETSSGSLSLANKDSLLQLVEDVDIVAIGPGLSRQEESMELAREIAMEITKPLLINGDAVAALCTNLEILRMRKGPAVLTLVPGEMTRISSTPPKEIDEYTVDMLQETAETLNTILVLREARSLIGLPDRRLFINMSGNSGTVKVRPDNILPGAIAAMYCLGLNLEEAVRQGVFISGFAEDLSVQTNEEDYLTADDILDQLPMAIEACRQGLSEAFVERYSGAQRI